MRLLTITAWLLALGCGESGGGSSSEAEPTRYSYTLQFAAGEAGLEDAVLHAGDRELATVRAGEGGRAEARFEVPQDTWLTNGPSLGLRVPTPCGPSASVPVVLDLSHFQERARESAAGAVRADLELAEEQPGVEATRLWFDPAGGTVAKLAVGQAEIASSAGQHTVRGVDCGASHQVRIDDRVIGEVNERTHLVPAGYSPEQGEVRVPAYFVSADPTACYRFKVVRYSTGPMPSPGYIPVFLRGASVYRLEVPIDDFLAPPPESTMAEGFVSLRRQLSRVDCADIPEHAQVTRDPLDTCTDGMPNAGETDVDCGGQTECPRCPRYRACTEDADCERPRCRQGMCQ